AGAHCLAEAIGGLYGHPHGYCCATSMFLIMEYNLSTSRVKYARLAQAFGIERNMRADDELARLAIEHIRRLNRSLKVPRLSTLVNAPALDPPGWKAEQNPSPPSNPRPAGAAAFKSMLARELARQA